MSLQELADAFMADQRKQEEEAKSAWAYVKDALNKIEVPDQDDLKETGRMPDVRVREYLTHCRSLYKLNSGVPPGGYTTFRAFDIFKCQELTRTEALFREPYEMVKLDLLFIKAPVMSFEEYVASTTKALNFRADCYKQFRTNRNKSPDGGYMRFEDFT
jgi:hypothetical protein